MSEQELTKSAPATGYRIVPRTKIVTNPFNPRKRFDEAALQELAASLRANGMLHPLVVRSLPEDKYGRCYEIISGERRYRASAIAGMTEIPILVRECSDAESAWLAGIENIDRNDLNPVENAQWMKQQMELEPDLTQDALADRLKIAQSTVAKRLALLELPPYTLGLVAEGTLTPAHAAGLMRYRAFPDATDIIAREVVANNITSKVLEAELPWQAQHALTGAGLIKQIAYNTPFDRSRCASCPHGAFFGRHGNGFCFNPRAYNEHVQEAADKAAEAQRAISKTIKAAAPADAQNIRALEAVSEALGRAQKGPAKASEPTAPDPEAQAALKRILALRPISSFDRDEIVNFQYGYGIPASCQKRECSCCSLVRGGSPDNPRAVPVCTDPKAHESLKRRLALQEGKGRRTAMSYLWDQAVAGRESSELSTHRQRAAGLVFARLIDGMTQGARREVLQIMDQGSCLYPIVRDWGGRGGDGRAHWDRLGTIPVEELIEATALMMLREEINSQLDYKGDRLPKMAFFLGQTWKDGQIPVAALAAEAETKNSARNKPAGRKKGK